MMTSAEFEAYIRELPRIRALRALQEAEIAMVPVMSNFNRKEWFRGVTKLLLPRFEGNNIVSFNGRKVSLSQLKRSFNVIAKKNKAEDVG